MKRLMDHTPEELNELIKSLGRPAFRAKQVNEWLMRGMRPEEMTNLPKDLRGELGKIPFGGASIHEKYLSAQDGTVKYLFALEDGNLVEGVLMRYHHGNTLCLSTQVGCRMNCAFCASTLEGRVRDLTAGEMLSEVTAIERDEPKTASGRAVTNIVLMGSGEPLDNYDNVVAFLKRAVAPDGLKISARNISLSTCGLVPNMKRLVKEAPPVTLCVSLHAHSDEQRSAIMPVNRTYPIAAVLNAAKEYAEETGRRVIFEYALIDGVNASKADAGALADRLKDINCHVNLIPLNPVPERDLKGATRRQAAQFADWLNALHVSATVRREMGTDIEGACGQLRRRVLSSDKGV
ncbi:MAG TPA: 23S rRNA (adenine(2503)-C(2))-methyltransferase RlmN [Feifaniaceae bacterium]|nr:23S rRNA (adenine(2503)-C(2))-methyltransferase RlmN [Feifaniaceae bacterium]